MQPDQSQTALQRPIAVDLFAGAGGMTLGFEQAGFDVLAAVDSDPVHCGTHEFNFPFWPVLCRDITMVTGREIRANSQIGDREIDVVFGGPPCQGFSAIGKRMLDDPRNRLILEFQRLVVELEPKYFVLENVRGIANKKHRGLLETLICQFEAQGYRVSQDDQILNAANYGVPQDRQRWFLLGSRQDCPLPQYPQPITLLASPDNCQAQSNDRLPVGPTVREALADLPTIERYKSLLTKDWVLAKYGEPSLYAASLRGLHRLEDDYSYPRPYNLRLLSSSRRTNHDSASQKRFRQTKPGQREPISHFYKLHPEGICNTLRAGTDVQRGSFTAARPIHYHKPRCITVREAARLHAYPDWFRFHATKWHGFRQVGNSVPPLLAKAIAAEIVRLLGVDLLQPTAVRELGDEKLLQMNVAQAAQHYG